MILRGFLFASLAAVTLAACAPPTSPPTPTPVASTSAPTSTTAAPVTTQPTEAPATATPAAVPTTAVTAAPATATAAPTTVAEPTETPPQAGAFGEEVLFLRGGNLLALDVATRQERTIADGVSAFSATPDGGTLAVVRTAGGQTDLWLVGRDSSLSQLTDDERTEASPSWSPDGLSLVFAAGDGVVPRAWPQWAEWCANSTVRVVDVRAGSETELGVGCDPAFAPDGRRIAFASPPTEPEAGISESVPVVRNSIRMVNRQGQNGWAIAEAEGPESPDPLAGRVVYGPSWSPDATWLGYHRFLGYQVLVDINLSEVAGSFDGESQPVQAGAGWALPMQFSPDGRTVAISEDNFSDARGFGGYDNWSVRLVRLEGERQTALPSGDLTLLGQEVSVLPRGQAAAWSPDGAQLAVQLPPNWSADLPTDEPLDVPEDAPGELWLWQPGQNPQERLVTNVDAASPLAWLPAAPTSVVGTGGYQLVYPAEWELAGPTEFEERTATSPDGLSLMSAAPSGVSDPNTATVSEMFSFFVAEGSTNEQPVTWPDGSVYRAFTGTDTQGRPIAGATRVVQTADQTVVLLYYTTRERWPFEQALAQALLARSGPLPG